MNLSLLFYVLQEIFSMPIYLRERFGELLYLTNDFRFFNLSRTALSLPVKSGFIFYFSMIIYFSIIIQKFTLMNKKNIHHLLIKISLISSLLLAVFTQSMNLFVMSFFVLFFYIYPFFKRGGGKVSRIFYILV